MRIAGGRITEIENVCEKGADWFGDGTWPAIMRCNGSDRQSLEAAVAAAAELLFDCPGRLLVYVAGDLGCETVREATALADRVGATIDTLAADTVIAGLLATARRGRATATLGELRHRADMVVFWGIDPDRRWPRFRQRFLTPEPTQASRREMVAVDIDGRCGPPDVSQRLALSRNDEVDALRVMQATVRGRNVGTLPPPLAQAASLATRLAGESRYAAIVFDAEPDELQPADPARTEALTAFVQALNGPTRAALFALRDGGNRNGFESLLTWQTGFPFAIDFGRGSPEFAADETVSERIERGRYAAALVLGAPSTLPAVVSNAFGQIPTVAVGPRASEAAFGPRIAIDTGVAGIHEGGLVLRMDDVPLQVEPLLSHDRSATDVVARLNQHAACGRGEVR